MKKHLVIVAALGLSLLSYANPAAPWMVDYYKAPAQLEAGCPSFPTPAYNSLTYNVGCIPWDLEWSGSMSGDVTGATYQWYRYPEGSSQATATPCDWQTDHTTPEGFKPATDENNSRYIYFCKVTTPNCPSGVNSAIFTVVVGSATDPCLTLTGTTFTITSGGSYSSGQTVTITATTTAYGGDHIYTWYHNGEALDVNDPRYTFVWGFNQPQLIITNVTPADGGTYSVMMQDGTECFMYTDPVRVLVDNPACGPNPTLAVQYSDMAEGGANQTGVSNNTLASGEVGTLVYMVQPDGSNPTTTAPGTWTTDLPGLYQFKYVVNNPDNPSCYRESKVVTVRVYACGETPTVTPDAEVLAITNTVHFTVPALGPNETGSISFTSDKGASGTIYPNTYPNFAHTCYTQGTYTYTYTITNSKAPGCNRTATCTVLWYHCGWGTAKFNASFPSTVKVGTAINLSPSTPEAGLVGTYTVSKDGGTPEVIDPSQPYTPTDPGTYVFTWSIKHSDPRVTDCQSQATKTIVVEPCGTKATISTNKSVLAVGESATLTVAAKASGETATLTYSKDGGAPSPITNLQSPINFTPTESGEYVFTYTIKPSGCSATSAQVTITVYDCGPEASITASQATVQPGGTITLTLSAPGTDETGTLTYTVNGGANNQLPITNNQSPITFTPTEEGVYVFTYAITHAYINCSRSAQTTVRVYNCGAPAGLATDKNTLKLGESAQLTLSRQPVAADGETATLTYTVNGGANNQLPITNNLSPITFPPDAVGTYIVTYAIDNVTLGCATSAQVTIHVYDCGPEASVALNKTTVRLGESVAVTLSALGADESATLTYTVNGGANNQLPITNNQSPIVFTPTELGEYVFTYTITHPYIECTRTATATLEVYDCGTPAAITTNKSALKLGESASLNLSAVLPVETATLTYSKDGGAQSPITNHQSPIVFTPTELGVYVITYTVSHTKIDCETSAQVTIHVYDCGPDIDMTLADTEIKIMRTTTINLSIPGADETATLTYTVNGGANNQLPITNNQSPIVFTPTELGEYVFTYTITHPYINCTRTVTATLRVMEAELVFDDKNSSHVWSDPKNWWPAYNRIPNAADSAIIRKACEVDIDNAVTYDLTIDMSTGTALTIQPAGALVVVHHLLQTRPNAILVQADATNNGALIVGPENTDIPADVAFFARSANKDDLYPVWQYMGLPIQEQTLISTAYPEAVFYEWTNTPNRQTGGNWQRIDSLAGSLVPFTGYCMTQLREKTYTVQGTLNNPVRKELAVPFNDQGSYPGFAFFANSWTAPIDIASLSTADFGAADATVYIMNSGTYEEAIQQQSSATTTGTGTARGQYNTIPVHAATYLSDALTVIPPMQGFFIHTNQPTTLVLDYDKAVYTPALTKVTTTPTRAPQNLQSSILNLKLSVSGYGAEDEVNLLVSDDFSPRFENGWDGYKARSEKSPISMAVQSADGDLAVAAIPELEGTEITFDGGNHKTYTITAEISNVQSPISNDLYLLDTESGISTELREGMTYSFKCGAATRQFKIVSLNDPINDQSQMTNDEPYKFIQDGILYIRQGNRLYNATGELISQ